MDIGNKCLEMEIPYPLTHTCQRKLQRTTDGTEKDNNKSTPNRTDTVHTKTCTQFEFLSVANCR